MLRNDLLAAGRLGRCHHSLSNFMCVFCKANQDNTTVASLPVFPQTRIPDVCFRTGAGCLPYPGCASRLHARQVCIHARTPPRNSYSFFYLHIRHGTQLHIPTHTASAWVERGAGWEKRGNAPLSTTMAGPICSVCVVRLGCTTTTTLEWEDPPISAAGPTSGRSGVAMAVTAAFSPSPHTRTPSLSHAGP